MEQFPEQPQQTPEAALQQNYRQVCELMLRINGKLYAEAHNAEPKNWADVGDMGHAVEVLQDLAAFLEA